jgi:hypothetical protein
LFHPFSPSPGPGSPEWGLHQRYLSGGNTLQGNFDPSRLLSPIPVIKKMVNEMIDEFKTNTLQTLDMVFCQIFLWITLKHL